MKIVKCTLVLVTATLGACASKPVVNVSVSQNAASSSGSYSGRSSFQGQGGSQSGAVAQVASSNLGDAGSVSHQTSIAQSASNSGGSNAYPSPVNAQGGNTRITTSSVTSSVTQVKKSGSSGSVMGTWSGVSRGERITVKFGSNGSLILTNTAGANPGNWASAGGGSYDVNIGGSGGQLVLVNSSTASLTIGGSSIELKKN